MQMVKLNIFRIILLGWKSKVNFSELNYSLNAPSNVSPPITSITKPPTVPIPGRGQLAIAAKKSLIAGQLTLRSKRAFKKNAVYKIMHTKTISLIILPKSRLIIISHLV